MTPEERLRRAIAARAQSVEPSDDGLDRITEKLLDPGGDMKLPPTSPNTRWYLVAAAAIVLAGIAGAITLVTKDDDDPDEVGVGSRTTVTLDPTTEPPTTTAPEDVPDGGAADIESRALWPRPSSEVRFDDPVAAVRSWARYAAHYIEPIIGDFQQGDNQSGEVEVIPVTSEGGRGPVTTVLVRILSDGNWYVIGSTTENITVTSPLSGDELACPVVLQGTALAYEGNVQVRIDAYEPDGDRVEVSQGFVTGSGSPPAGPFDDTLACRIPSGVERYGLVSFFTTDQVGDDGGAWETVTFPVRLR